MLEGLDFGGEASTRKLGGGVAMADGTNRGVELRPDCARLVAANRGEGLGRGDQRQFQLALQASWRGQRRRRLAAAARGMGAARVVVHGVGRVGLPAWARSRGPWACKDFTACAGGLG
jgi:O-acetyl-ADP-ribose deacetylase (regulator of RNase III)